MECGCMVCWDARNGKMETFSALLAFCARNKLVTGECHARRPVTWSFDVFFELRLNQQLSKQCRIATCCLCCKMPHKYQVDTKRNIVSLVSQTILDLQSTEHFFLFQCTSAYSPTYPCTLYVTIPIRVNWIQIIFRNFSLKTFVSNICICVAYWHFNRK